MNINKVFLSGRVGKDPEIIQFQSGDKAVSFTLATTDKGFTKKDGSVIPDRTEWHNIKAYGGLVTYIEKAVKKGSAVSIIGKLHNYSTDNNGQKRYYNEVIVETIDILGSKIESVGEPNDLPF